MFFPNLDAKELVSSPHQCIKSSGKSGIESVGEASNIPGNAVQPLHSSLKSGMNDVLTPYMIYLSAFCLLAKTTSVVGEP